MRLNELISRSWCYSQQYHRCERAAAAAAAKWLTGKLVGQMNWLVDVESQSAKKTIENAICNYTKCANAMPRLTHIVR